MKVFQFLNTRGRWTAVTAVALIAATCGDSLGIRRRRSAGTLRFASRSERSCPTPAPARPTGPSTEKGIRMGAAAAERGRKEGRRRLPGDRRRRRQPVRSGRHRLGDPQGRHRRCDLHCRRELVGDDDRRRDLGRDPAGASTLIAPSSTSSALTPLHAQGGLTFRNSRRRSPRGGRVGARRRAAHEGRKGQARLGRRAATTRMDKG